jgi:cytochrome c5
MNEMLTKSFNRGESHMKKTLIIVALAAVLVLALGATPAFAKYAGYSSTKQYVPWAEAQSMASLNADAALMASGPHKGYATTTIKCAVCHSVHRGTTTLLNSGTSCAYCHAPVAEGGGAIATNLISWYTPAQGPHSSCGSNYCHGGPHGVGASNYAGPASKLLTHLADAELDKLVAANVAATGSTYVADLTTYNANTRALATGAVCGRDGCHSNSVFGVVAAGAQETGMAGATMVTGHRVIATASANWNDADNNNAADNTIFPTNVTGTIAYAGVTYCNSCHDLADDNNGGKKAFPHGLSGVVNAAVGADGTWRPAVWLTAGAYAGAPRQAVGGYADYSAAAPGAAGGSIIDGTCLKCHASDTAGLGMTY